MGSYFKYRKVLLGVLLAVGFDSYIIHAHAGEPQYSEPLIASIKTADCNIPSLPWKDIRRIAAPDIIVDLYKNCPGSWRLGYLAAVSLYNAGKLKEAGEIVKNVRHRAPNYAPAKVLDEELNRPYQRAFEAAQKQFRQWLDKPLDLPPFEEAKPKPPMEPPLPVLKKGEFEKYEAFRSRVETASRAREYAIKLAADRYRQELDAYKESVGAHNRLKKEKIAERNERAPYVFNKILSRTLYDVFGYPVLSNLNYESEGEVFYANLRSQDGRFDHKVIIKVPLSIAPRMKQDIAQASPHVGFEKDGSRLELTSMHVVFDGKRYEMELTDQDFVAPVIEERVIAMNSLRYTEKPMLEPETEELTDYQRDELLRKNDAYFEKMMPGISSEKIELWRQDQILRKKVIEQKRIRSQRREIKEYEERIKKRKEELARLGDDDFKGLQQIKKWSFTRKARNWGEDSIAVIIGNREYTGLPLDHYAKNDALAVKQFARQTLQIPDQNIYYFTNITKGSLEGLVETTLPKLVKKGRTNLLFYFSGHGIAVEDDAKILPSDTAHTYAKKIGYSRNRLISKLGSSRARRLVMVLDACFTGQTKRTGRRLMDFKMVTPVAPMTFSQPPENSLVITAGQADEVAWSSDSYGMSLMTNYLLEGLKGAADKNRDGRINTDELRKYLHNHVDREALASHNQHQRPTVLGAASPLVRY